MRTSFNEWYKKQKLAAEEGEEELALGDLEEDDPANPEEEQQASQQQAWDEWEDAGNAWEGYVS
eukprot:5747684-Amphidinium_carterae.1